jgi:hypothetical protein
MPAQRRRRSRSGRRHAQQHHPNGGVGGEGGLGGDADMEVARRRRGEATVGVVPEHAGAGCDGQRWLLGEVEDAFGLALDGGVLGGVKGGDAEQRADQDALADSMPPA